VLEEAELAAGPEHPVELGARLGLVGHRTQHQRDDGGVHAGVCGRERGGGAVQDVDGDWCPFGGPFRQPS
jgi:hypothetical protein